MNLAPLRKLKAQMVLKGLSLGDVAERSGVPYAAASEVLNGRRVHADYLDRIRKVIQKTPMPAEEVAA